MFSSTLKTVRTQSTLFFNPVKSYDKFCRKSNSNTIRFQQAVAGVNNPPDDNMEKREKNEEGEKKGGDAMSQSFGEGYAMRSDEEGFGGIYGGNQSLSKGDEEKIVHGNSPDYDKFQGSEVKEKEKGRHQTMSENK